MFIITCYIMSYNKPSDERAGDHLEQYSCGKCCSVAPPSGLTVEGKILIQARGDTVSYGYYYANARRVD